MILPSQLIPGKRYLFIRNPSKNPTKSSLYFRGNFVKLDFNTLFIAKYHDLNEKIEKFGTHSIPASWILMMIELPLFIFDDHKFRYITQKNYRKYLKNR
jgi:hypothetical protein